MKMKNLLLEKFDTAYSSVPFDKIKNTHFKPAFEQAIAAARAEVDAIIANKEKASFENTIEALDFSGMKLDRVSAAFFNLNSAETNPEIQKIAQEISPLLSEFSNDIRLNKNLFARVKAVYDAKTSLQLDAEQKMLLDKKYKGFIRNGALLNEADKDKLRAIDKKLAQLKLTFGENVLAETNAFELLIVEEDELSGLPRSAKEAARLLATEKGKDGWLFTLNFPSYYPVMKFAANRELRKKMAIAYGKRAFQGGKHDNSKIVLAIAKARHKRANLLGYKTHADFVLEERMAENPKKVTDFLSDLLHKTKPFAQREFVQLANFAQATDRIDSLQKWDGAYYTEKIKKQLFDLDDEQLKPYFQLENVIEGVFTIAKKLYKLNFKEIDTVSTYHKDVKTYEVTDTAGKYVALFYADFFPREGKRNGAWMTSFKGQYKKDGKNSRPHISIVCNFTKPTETKPSLLTFNEVTTLFHEFGHALHGVLADTTYPSLSGTNVSWDFVELPSQIMENWAYEEEALKLFAKHYETGELIPMELIEKIRKTSTFMEGLFTLRQLSFGILDMQWHGQDNSNVTDVKSFEKEAFKSTQLYPDVAENCMSTAFSHIFSGGYSSGYYSYKWAEVLDADAFELFKAKGIFNQEIATAFQKNILAKGGTEKPMDLYVQFRGQEPKSNALLKRSGLV
jgi:peptidyl-dipeptidase Dcp